MASPTTPNQQPLPPQAPTPGVGATPARPDLRQGAAPTGVGPNPAQSARGVGVYPPREGGVQPSMSGVVQSRETLGAEPILFEDIDVGLLARVYPHKFSVANSEAAQVALEQGNRTREEAQFIRANMDEDVPQPESGTAAAPTDRPSSSRPQVAPSRPGEPGLHGQPTAAAEAFVPQQHAGDTPQYPATGQPPERSPTPDVQLGQGEEAERERRERERRTSGGQGQGQGQQDQNHDRERSSDRRQEAEQHERDKAKAKDDKDDDKNGKRAGREA